MQSYGAATEGDLIFDWDTQGQPISISREIGRGAEVIAVRSLTRNPLSGAIETAALKGAIYCEHVTLSILTDALGIPTDVATEILADLQN